MTTPTRQRLLQAALTLFATQGVTETTTRQIAEQAGVNEVTLFRQFGNKHGLLLAALEESPWLARLGEYLQEPPLQADQARPALKIYAAQHLEALAQIPEFMRSVIGEAGQYTPEMRRALGQALRQANQYAAEYFAEALQAGALQSQTPPERIASLFNGLLLGYALIQSTSEANPLWRDQEDFLESFITLFFEGALALAPEHPSKILDLPPPLVHELLQRAKKSHPQDYALVYSLFATGLAPEELMLLQRFHPWVEEKQYFLKIPGGRQVAINQYIWGKRYGAANNNPLSQWINSRKDHESALWINEQGKPMVATEVPARWYIVSRGLLTPEGKPPALEQTRHTWIVEMLLRGISAEDLGLLAGVEQAALQPYIQRVRAKIALEQAAKADR